MSTRSVRRVAAATALIVSFAVSACTSSATTEGTAEYVDDVVITSKVRMAVVNAPGLNSSEINVETFKGRVQLSGFVRSPADIDQAMTVARGVEGVTSVSNDMLLR